MFLAYIAVADRLATTDTGIYVGHVSFHWNDITCRGQVLINISCSPISVVVLAGEPASTTTLTPMDMVMVHTARKLYFCSYFLPGSNDTNCLRIVELPLAHDTVSPRRPILSLSRF